ncbi:isochorismatase family protein [Acetobacteraceae bacterium H6797]|nr:isochorismatase family protein [Acetobacteraceae bacterium H6797]
MTAFSLPDPASTALLVIDPLPGALGEVAEPCAALLEAARQAGLLVLFLSPEAARGQADFAPGFACATAPNEAPVRTGAAGPFGATDLGLILRSNGVRSLVLAGANRAHFVTCAARDAAARGYAVIEAAGCLAGPACGAAQIPGATLTAAWAATAPGPRHWQAEVKHARLRRSLEERVAPGRAALVLIDVQNDFCAPDGATGRRQEAMPLVHSAVPRIQQLLGAARAAGVDVVHVRAEYGPLFRSPGSPYRFPSTQTREGAVWSASAADISEHARFAPDAVEVCLTGQWGGEFLDGFGPLPGETVITKHRYSAFIDTPLEATLRAKGIETVILAGVTTNCCVESTARDASMLDFYLVVAEDGVGTKDLVRDLHAASLEQIRTYFGRVDPVARIIEAWRGSARQAA